MIELHIKELFISCNDIVQDYMLCVKSLHSDFCYNDIHFCQIICYLYTHLFNQLISLSLGQRRLKKLGDIASHSLSLNLLKQLRNRLMFICILNDNVPRICTICILYLYWTRVKFNRMLTLVYSDFLNVQMLIQKLLQVRGFFEIVSDHLKVILEQILNVFFLFYTYGKSEPSLI